MKTTRALTFTAGALLLLAVAALVLLHLEISVPALFERVIGVVVSAGLLAFLLGAGEPHSPCEHIRPPAKTTVRQTAFVHRLRHAH